MTSKDRVIKLAHEAYTQLRSYTKLANIIGVSRQQAHRICTGQSEASADVLVRLQDYLRKAA